MPYVVITPARNERQFIELTLRSVVSQTVKPLRWIIVSDGSTDGTDEVVREYAACTPWIELLRMPERQERNFSGKVLAFRAGQARMRGLEYEVIASLDADISLDEEYFEFLLAKLDQDPALGVVGTPFKEGFKPTYDYRFVNIAHVSGACQVFRRRCFEEIGGYTLATGGGIDYIAVTAARMRGWKTRTYTEKVCRHHREMGTAQSGVLMARFKLGAKDYALGHHPVWELSRAIYQMTQRPYIIGGIALAGGFAWSMIRRAHRSVSPELRAFARREQMSRLTRFFTRLKDPVEVSLPPPPGAIER